MIACNKKYRKYTFYMIYVLDIISITYKLTDIVIEYGTLNRWFPLVNNKIFSPLFRFQNYFTSGLRKW